MPASTARFSWESPRSTRSSRRFGRLTRLVRQVSQVCRPKPQGVENDRYGTKRHRKSCDDGTEQDAEGRVQHARGDGDPDCVVGESEYEVLPDVTHGHPAERPGPCDPGEIAFD